jgi:hypothetical protein
MTGGTVMAIATPRHSLFWQVAVSVDGSPSSHGSPSGFCASGGQASPVPLQLSGWSHGPAAGRQTVVAGARTSAGQSGPSPAHVCLTSHAPAASRQTVPAGSKRSTGHAAAVPVQVSAVSHAPAGDRQTAVDGFRTSAGHVALVPVQVSATSQGPAVSRQVVPAFPGRKRQNPSSQVSTVQTLPSSH